MASANHERLFEHAGIKCGSPHIPEQLRTFNVRSRWPTKLVLKWPSACGARMPPPIFFSANPAHGPPPYLSDPWSIQGSLIQLGCCPRCAYSFSRLCIAVDWASAAEFKYEILIQFKLREISVFYHIACILRQLALIVSSLLPFSLQQAQIDSRENGRPSGTAPHGLVAYHTSYTHACQFLLVLALSSTAFTGPLDKVEPSI